MFHRLARRGTAVLMLVLALALAGARPAAARPGADSWHAAVSWLVSLWQAATGGPGQGPAPDGDRGAGLDPNGDRGAGLDPNGSAPRNGPGSAP